jgi:hypothetical protein
MWLCRHKIWLQRKLMQRERINIHSKNAEFTLIDLIINALLTKIRC